MKRTAILLATLLPITFLSTVTAQPGSLDPDYGDMGLAVVEYELLVPGYTRFLGMATLPDGSVVAGGDNETDVSMLIARFQPDGSLDPSFGSGGIVAGIGYDYLVDVAVLPDGRIMAYGRNDAVTYAPTLRRLLANGDPDPSFPVLNFSVPPGSSYLEPTAMVPMPDGRTLILANNGLQPWIRMILPDGPVDIDWNVSPPLNFNGNALLLSGQVQPDGKILLHGVRNVSTSPRAVVVRLLPDGSLDTSFGELGNGVVSLDVLPGPDHAASMVLQNDGSIVLLNWGPTLMRLTPDGLLDTGFGDQGVLPITLPGLPWSAPSPNDLWSYLYFATGGMTQDAQGNLIVAAVVNDGYRLARVLPDGTMDPAFGSDGVLVPDSGPGFGPVTIARVAVSGQRILAAGQYITDEHIGASVTAFINDVGTGGMPRIAEAEQPGLYPQPVLRGEMLHVQTPGLGTAALPTRLFDAQGRMVARLESSLPLAEDTHGLMIPADLPAGLYVLDMATSDRPLPRVRVLVQ